MLIRAAQIVPIPLEHVLRKLPELCIFYLDHLKLSITFEIGERPVTIVDIQRPLVYYQLPTFTRLTNDSVPSISELHEDYILRTGDMETLKLYLSYPRTEVTPTFLDLLQQIYH
jgi:hypothetical protein